MVWWRRVSYNAEAGVCGGTVTLISGSATEVVCTPSMCVLGGVWYVRVTPEHIETIQILLWIL